MTDAQSEQTALNKLIEAVEAGELQQPQCIKKHEDDHDCSDDWLLHPLLDLVPYGVLHVHQMGDLVRAYEGSLDAALALHEALLPGWRMDALWQGGTLCRNENDWSCRLRCVSEKRRAIENDEREALPTPARAWLLAILRAYRSTQL